MEQRIWTIGHSIQTLQTFIGMLQAHGVEMIVDVRTHPASRRVPWFNKEPFSEALAAQAIGYVHIPGLGGRRRPYAGSLNTAWRNESFRGYADHMGTPEFEVALCELKEIAEAHRSCIMCAEVLWWRCHRSLIADRMKADGWTVLHIMAEKEMEHPYTKAARIINHHLSYTGPAS